MPGPLPGLFIAVGGSNGWQKPEQEASTDGGNKEYLGPGAGVPAAVWSIRLRPGTSFAHKSTGGDEPDMACVLIFLSILTFICFDLWVL